jgi:hypothetical protein
MIILIFRNISKDSMAILTAPPRGTPDVVAKYAAVKLWNYFDIFRRLSIKIIEAKRTRSEDLGRGSSLSWVFVVVEAAAPTTGV